MNMSASTSTPLEYLYEESSDVEGEYILLGKPNKRLSALHDEILKVVSEQSTCNGVKYNINLNTNLTNNLYKRKTIATNDKYGVVFIDRQQFRPIRQKTIMGSDFVGVFRTHDEWKPYKSHFKCKINDCDMTIKSLKEYLKMNNVKNLSRCKKMDLINLYMKL